MMVGPQCRQAARRLAVDIEDGDAAVGRSHAYAAGSVAKDFLMLKVGALIDIEDERGDFAPAQIAHKDDLKLPVVEFRARRDPHAAAEELAVGDDDIIHLSADFLGLVEAYFDVDIFIAQKGAYRGEHIACSAAETLPGSIDDPVDSARKADAGDIDKVARRDPSRLVDIANFAEVDIAGMLAAEVLGRLAMPAH